MIHWLTTKPSGRAHTHSADDGATGWKLHAVEGGADTISYKVTFADVRWTRAMCGLLPKNGWSGDLFVDAFCIRCAGAMKRKDIENMTEEDAKKLLRQLSITLKFVGSRKGKRQVERTLNQLEKYRFSKG